MPLFTQAESTKIYGGSFTDVQGDYVSITQGDPTLQLLLLQTATGAAYNSHERYPPPKCHPNTRKSFLEKLDVWIGGGGVGKEGGIAWLHGPAGAGKSAIAQTVCESSASRSQLAASFFFSRAQARRDSGDFLFTTIAFQLAMASLELRDKITQAVHDNPLIIHETAAAQVERLIVRPVKSLVVCGTTAPRPPFLIVVDGVDECDDNRSQELLLSTLVDLVRTHKLPLYILIISRPEPHIRHVFNSLNVSNLEVLSLYGSREAYQDVYSFLVDRFEKIHGSERHSYIMKSVPKPWPSKLVIDAIAQKSGGYFIYASTILGYVDEEYFSPIDRLDEIMNASPALATSAFSELDKLYTRILSTSPNVALLKLILGCILLPLTTLAPYGVTPSVIELVLGLRSGEVMLTLRGLHSLLHFQHYSGSVIIPGPDSGLCITSIHASLADFIFHKERAGTFYIDIQEHHTTMALDCWRRFADWPCTETRQIPVGGRWYLFESFSLHFAQVQQKCQILEGLVPLANKITWEPIVHASKSWLVIYKHRLVEVVEEVVHGFKALGLASQGRTENLIALIDFIYTVHLSPRSAADIRFIQGIFTMTTSEKFPSDDVGELAQFLQVSQFIHPSWVDIHEFMNTWHERGIPRGQRLCERPSFLDFMNDTRRSGNLSIDSATRHTRLTVCCMETLISWIPLHSASQYYAAKNLWWHLLKVPAGEKRVLEYFQGPDVNIFSFGTAWDRLDQPSVVILWLQRMPRPPVNALSRWRMFEKAKAMQRAQTYTSSRPVLSKERDRCPVQ